MPTDFNYLEEKDFDVITGIFTSGKLEYNSTERRVTYLNGVHNKFRTETLNTIETNQIVQLHSDLNILSQTFQLTDDSIPIRQWLKNISRKLDPLPEKKDIDEILKKVEEKIKIIGDWDESNDDPTDAQIKTFSLFREINKITNRKRSNPFLGLELYSTNDGEFFFGRENETKNLVDKIVIDKKSIALKAKPFTGKTSLINSGIIPKLKEKYANYRILTIENYEDFPARIEEVVQALPVNYYQTLTDDLISDISRPTVIIFDQFEKICDFLTGSEDEQKVFEGFKTIFNKNLQVIIAYRNDEPVIRLIAELNAETKDNLHRYSLLTEFINEHAVNIILDLLRKQDHVKWDGTSTIETLVNDCAQLGRNNESVNPQLLQIVCKKLFELAESSENKTISNDFYQKIPARELLSQHFEDTLRNDLIKTNAATASQILAFFETAGDDYSATFKQIKEFSRNLTMTSQNTEEDLTDETLEEILKDLQRLKLIIKQKSDEVTKYYPPFKLYSEKANEITDNSELYDELLINQEFHYAWLFWKKDQKRLISPQQSEKSDEKKRWEELEERWKKLKPNPEQTLLLLRSAVENNEPADFWLESLKKNNGQELIEKLQKIDSLLIANLQDFDSSANGSRTLNDFEAAVTLFMEPGESGSESPDNSGNWLSKRAVLAEKSAIRQTAVLALTLEAGDEGFDLKKIITPELSNGFWQRFNRRSELAGTLLEYLPRDKTNNLKLSVTDRLLAWRWRVNRRMRQDGLPINNFLKYSALYGGLIFGVSKLGVFLSEDEISFLTFFNTIVMLIVGAILAWFVAKGMLWARYSFIIFSENTSNSSSSNNKSKRMIFSNSLVIVVGALCFGLFNSSYLPLLPELTFFTSLLVIGLGFIAGVGIGMGLYIKSNIFEDKIFGWIIGLLVTVMFFIAVQSIFAFGFENKWGLFLTQNNHSQSTIISRIMSLVYAIILGAYLYLSLGIGEAKVKEEQNKSILFG